MGREILTRKGLEEWDSLLGDKVRAAALIDGLLRDRHIVNIRGNSYRMPEHRNLVQPESEQPSRGGRAVNARSLDGRV